jgi:drug/metabolite transporter (DMT)-like permease
VLEDRRAAVLAFAFLVLFWGSAFAAIKVGLRYSPPILFAGTRTLLCGVTVTLAALVWGGGANLRRDWWIYALLAALNVVGFFGLQTFAILYMPSGSAAVVIYLQPILVGLLAFVVLGEPLSAAKVVGLILGFLGIVAVSAGSLFSGASAETPFGVAFGASSAVAWALGTVYFKKYGERLSTLWSGAVPFTLGGVLLTGLGLGLESFSEISWNGTYVASWLYTSLVGTALAWLLWLGLVSAGEASRVSAYVFFVPLVSILVGALLLGEALSPSLLTGAALVVLGIYLVNRRGVEDGKEGAPSR